MYCPACGIDSVDGLKYCKRCGATLSAAQDDTSRKKSLPVPVGLFLLVIVFIAAVGLSTPLLMAHDLIHNSGFTPRDVMLFFLFSSLVTFGIIGLLVRVLLRLISAVQPGLGAATTNETTTKAYLAPQLNVSLPLIGSVTENTTRSFEQRRHVESQRIEEC